MNQNLYDKPKVGGDILSYCGTCKLELAHVIVAMVDNAPARIQCKTCRSQRNYKRKTFGTKTTTPRTPKVAKPKDSLDWQRKMSERTTKVHLDYSLKEKYKTGDCLLHPKFGLGLVEEVKLNGKIVVLFRDGEITLVHGIQ